MHEHEGKEDHEENHQICLIITAIFSSPVFATNSTETETTDKPSFLCLAARFVSISNEIVEEDAARVQAEEEAAEAARIAAEEAAAEEEWYETYGGYGGGGYYDYSYNYSGPEEFWLSSNYHGASQSAIDAGGIVEFYDHYYASHNYDAGGIFYNFSPGDVVHIDGQDVVIEGSAYFDYNANNYWDIQDVIGTDAYGFQTCTGPGSEVVVYYGHAQ